MTRLANSGRSGQSCGRVFRKSQISNLKSQIPSTRSSSRSSKPTASLPRRPLPRKHCCDGCSTRSRACRRRRRTSPNSLAINRRTPTRKSSIGCLTRGTTASIGGGTGSISSVMPNRTALNGTIRSRSSGGIAITSSARSTPTSRMTNSSASNWPAMNSTR